MLLPEAAPTGLVIVIVIDPARAAQGPRRLITIDDIWRRERSSVSTAIARRQEAVSKAFTIRSLLLRGLEAQAVVGS